MTLRSQKFFSLPFLTEVWHETVARGPLFRKARFTGAPCSLFDPRPFRAGTLALSDRSLPLSLSLWRGAHVEIARATLSSLWNCQMALVVGAHFDDQGDLAQRS